VNSLHSQTIMSTKISTIQRRIFLHCSVCTILVLTCLSSIQPVTAVRRTRAAYPAPTPSRSPSSTPMPPSLSQNSSSCRLVIGFLPALSNKGQYKHFVGAFYYALQRANETLRESGSHCYFDSETMDNKADTGESLRAMTVMNKRDIVAFIGPEDTCATEARVAAAWNIPMIAFVSPTLLFFKISLLTPTCMFLPKRKLFYSEGVTKVLIGPVLGYTQTSCLKVS